MSAKAGQQRLDCDDCAASRGGMRKARPVTADVAWLLKRPELADEPEANPIGDGIYYLRGVRPLRGLAWAQCGDRIYRVEVVRRNGTSASWSLYRGGTPIDSGLMRAPWVLGLRDLVADARNACETSLRLDITAAAAEQAPSAGHRPG